MATGWERTLTVPGEYPTIQAAILDASDGDTVLVSNGTYHERLNFYGKDIILKSVNGAGNTTIDGDGSGPVLNFWSYSGTNSTIDGFAIRNGSTDKGGGLKSNNSNPTLKNCIFENNAATFDGGAVYLNGASVLTVQNSTFRNNDGNGGAIFVTSSGTTLDIDASVFEYNSSYHEGGAIKMPAGVDVNISGSSFTRNDGTKGGAIYALGAIDMDISASSANYNTATGWEGGAIYISGASNVNIDDTELIGNSASRGGAIYSNGTTLGVSDVKMNGNIARSWEGGGIYIASGTVDVDRTEINGNSSMRGGGLYAGSSTVNLTNVTLAGNKSTPYQGGGIYSAADMTIYNSTIAGNYAGDATNGRGGGIYIFGGTTNVKNSVLWGNRSEANNLKNQMDGNAAVVAYTDINQDGYAYSNGNIRQNPQFVAAASYGTAPTTNGDYHLLPGSLCEGAANYQYAPVDDIDGDSRPQGTGYDMGSDENSGGSPGDTTPPSVTSVLPSGTIGTTSATVAAYYNDSGSGINSASVAMYLDGSPLSGCTITGAYAACNVYGLGNGSHTIGGSVSDNAGNTSPISGSFTVSTGGGDTTPPTVYNLKPSTVIYTSSAVLSGYYSDTGSGIDTSTVVVKLDGTTVGGCTVVADHVSCPMSGLTYGLHTIDVSVKDNAGNLGSGSIGFFVMVTCDSGQPPLTLYSDNTYWATYDEFLAGILSVDFSIRNSGSLVAHDVVLQGATATNGVVCVTQGIPMSLGDISGGESKPLTLKYAIPVGVTNFKTTLYVNGDDSCGNNYGYPGPYPG